MKLFKSTTGKITKDTNDENIPHLKIAELILVHCNLVNISDWQNSRALYGFVPVNHLGNIRDFTNKSYVL